MPTQLETPSAASPHEFATHATSTDASRRPLPVRFALWLLHSIPTVVVLGLLAAVGWWGHHTNWAMPKFSELTGSAANGKPDDEWCAEHGVLEAECLQCLREDGKLPKGEFHGWCKVHGVSECPFEHPDVVQLLNPPDVTGAQIEAAEIALATRPRTRNNAACKLHEKIVQLASRAAQEKAGIDIAVAEVEPVVESLAVNGQVTFDPARVAHLSSPVPGRIWRVDRSIGDRVEPGELLLLVESTEVGKAKGEFLQALGDLRLKQINLDSLAASAKTAGAVSPRSLREAQAAANEAEVRLLTAKQALANLGLPVEVDELIDLAPKEVARRVQFLGIPTALVSSVSAATSSSNLVPLLAPIAGVVVEREAVRGEVVDTSIRLFTVADVERLWVQLDIPQEDAKFVAIGQTMTFQPDGSADERQAEIAWISSSVDERTRTVKVRAEIANPDGRLKASAYGAGRIVLRQQPAAVVVPNDAVQWEGCCHVVFVRDKDYLKEGSPKVFHVRKVRVGVKSDRFTEIIAGIRPGEVVATKGSEALRAAILGTFGEACCEHGHHH